VQCHRNGLRDIRGQQERGTVDLYASFVCFGVWGKLILCDGLQVSAAPPCLDKQRVNIRKRTDAPLNGLPEAVDRIGLRNGYDSLDICKNVLAAMLCFTDQGCDLFLTSLLLGNVASDL